MIGGIMNAAASRKDRPTDPLTEVSIKMAVSMSSIANIVINGLTVTLKVREIANNITYGKRLINESP